MLPALKAQPVRAALLGASAPFHGFRLLTANPSLFRYFAGALATQTLAFFFAVGALGYWGWGLWQTHAPDLLAGLPEVIAGLASVFAAFGVVAVATIAGSVLVVALSGIFLTPWLDLLSERVENQIGGIPQPNFDSRAFARGVLRGAAHSALNLVVYVALMTGVSVVGLLSVVGFPLSLIAGSTLTAVFLAAELLDFTQARRSLTWLEKWRFFRAHWRTLLPFGFVLQALLAVPLFNTMFMCVGVIAATWLYLQLQPPTTSVPSSAPPILT